MQLTPLMADKFAAFIRVRSARNGRKVVKDVGIDPQ